MRGCDAFALRGHVDYYVAAGRYVCGIPSETVSIFNQEGLYFLWVFLKKSRALRWALFTYNNPFRLSCFKRKLSSQH